MSAAGPLRGPRLACRAGSLGLEITPGSPLLVNLDRPPLLAAMRPITFQSVQREAGVSHAFLYANADLRARIERLRDQARPKPSPPDGAGCDNTIIQALTSRYPRGAGDLPDPLLPSAVQVERGLQQPPLQLAAVGPDHLLPLPVVQEPRLVRRPGQQPGELLGRAGAYR